MNRITTLTDSITSSIAGTVADTMNRLDLSRFDLSAVELPKFDVPKFEVPKFDMPKFDMPKFDMPKFDMPKFDLPVDAERVANLARDVAYVGVGAVVVAAQQADESARSVASTVTDAVASRVRQLVAAR